MSLKKNLILFMVLLSLLSMYKTQNTDCSEFEAQIKDLQQKNIILQDKVKQLEKENEELKEWKRKKEEEEGKQEEEEKEEEKDENEDLVYTKLDSRTIEKKEEFSLLYKRLKKDFKEIVDFKLLYRGSVDGKSSADFHKKCDGKGNTISIIRSNQRYVFGGYAVNKWTKNAFTWVNDDLKSFVFSLNLMKIYDSTPTYNQKYHLGEYSGPQFWAFTCSDDTGYSKDDVKPFGSSVQTIYHDGNLHFTGFPSKYEINGGKNYFYIDEIEVFQVVYKN